MARVFLMFEDEQGKRTGRGRSFHGLISYVLSKAAPDGWHGSEGLALPLSETADEMRHTYCSLHFDALRRGAKTRWPVLHVGLGWHADDLAWLTREHVAERVRLALRCMRLQEHQCVWAVHTDTGKPHVHLVVNVIHPITGDVARMGLVKKRMSELCAAYERELGDTRCLRRCERDTIAKCPSRMGKPQPDMMLNEKSAFKPISKF